MKKSSLLVALLVFSSLVFAKSYSVSVANPTKVGGTQLAQGSYTVSVEGDKAIFKDSRSKLVSVSVKLENGTGKKFDATSMEITQKDGVDVIKMIHLGGSTTTLEFGD